MNEKMLENAKRLAARPYQIRIFADETTDGDPGYYAMIPELPGCVSDGATVEEAKKNLEAAKVDFIYFLLQDGLTIPEPQLAGSSVRIDMFEYLGVELPLPQQERPDRARTISA